MRAGTLVWRAGCATFALTLIPMVGEAQERDLGSATATHPESFGLVNSVRELADGRVMVADPLGLVFVMMSADLQTSDTLGGEGQGPEEYRQPDAVWPLPGDSTLLVDLGNARLTVVASDGSFVRTRPIVLSEFQPGRGLSAMIPGGTDSRGRIYFQNFGSPGADSSAVLRFDPATQTTDTVLKVKRGEVVTSESGAANNRNQRTVPVPLSPQDDWTVSEDGRVAAVRARDYHVDWVQAGRMTSGPPASYRPVRIGSAEQEEWSDDQGQTGGGVGVSVSVVNGAAQVGFSRGAPGGGSRGDLSDQPWPDVKPPFVVGSAVVDGTGRVWVRRSLPAGNAPLYDVFDAQGRSIGQIRFPEARRLVGFGASGVYVVWTDDFDLQRLERYSMPTF